MGQRMLPRRRSPRGHRHRSGFERMPMIRGRTLALVLAAINLLDLGLSAAAQSPARLPPPSTLLGDVRRGRDGQLELVPRSMHASPGRTRTGRPLYSPGPAPGTPWTAKDQPPRVPQLQFEETLDE